MTKQSATCIEIGKFIGVLALALSSANSASLAFSQDDARQQSDVQSTLSIVNAGAADAEDAPFVGASYRFLPGETLFFAFQMTGFAVKSQEAKELKSISLHYRVTIEDANGLALAQPVQGDVQSQLNPEDKNWVPKRRCSFSIPSFVAAGQYSVQVQAEDHIAKTRTSRNIAFEIGGTTIRPAESLNLQNFRFTRDEGGTQGLDVAAFRPGDSVYSEFVLVGFQFNPDKQYHVSYSVVVTGPSGKPFVSAPQAANLQAAEFYPPQFLPGNFVLSTSKDSQPGQYVMVITAHDLVGKRDSSTTQVFSLEQ